MTGAILTLNAGSSSLKFALFDAAATTALVRGGIEEIGAAPHLLARDAAGTVIAERRWPAGRPDPFAHALDALLAFAEAHLDDAGPADHGRGDQARGDHGPGDQGRGDTRRGSTRPGDTRLGAVGHRIVHGGADHVAPERVSPALLASLESLTPLDPLHMPNSLAPIRAVLAARPALPQVACFDTAFHHACPPVARQFALPRALTDAGIRRYGFHGLSYEYIAARLPEVSPRLAAGRVVAAHLGAGASLCALLAGRSIDTTMGFSALDGLMMATRCGSLDPGVMLHLVRQGHGVADIEDILYRRSGLLGVSGISGDVRVLLASTDPHAREALELFGYRAAGQVAALATALGGLDGLVFAGGIGEHAAPVRQAVCARLEWLGLQLDEAANAAGSGLISSPRSAVEVHVVATDEEAMIARHTRRTVQETTP